MKPRIIFTLFTVTFFCMMSSPAIAWYYAIGAGSGGDADTESLTVEFGKENIELWGGRYLAALSVPLVFHGDDNIPSGTKSTTIPHQDFDVFGTVSEGTEVGLLAKVGVALFSSKTYLTVLTGASRVNRVKIIKSNTTDIPYEQSSDDAVKGVFGIGFSYFTEFFEWGMKMNLSLDVDNRRGVTCYIGWGW